MTYPLSAWGVPWRLASGYLQGEGPPAPKYGSPWWHILPPKNPHLWRSRGMSNRPSRPTREEESPSYRRAMIDAERGRLP